MKLYLFYLKKEFDHTIPCNVYLPFSAAGKYDGNSLYGVTINKKYAKLFMKYHNESLICIVRNDIDKKYFENNLKTDLNEYMITPYILDYKDKKFLVLMTKGEYVQVEDFFQENAMEILSEITDIPYEIFDDEAQKYLNDIGYYYDHITLHAEPEEMDILCYNDSFINYPSIIKNINKTSKFYKYLILFRKIINIESFLSDL